MRLFAFESYGKYVEAQTACSRAKLDKTWVGPAECDALANAVRTFAPLATFGLCHGVRSGYEVAYLRRALGIEVVGTEISDIAEQFEHVVRQDFHDVRPGWIGKAGFVYSNSLDHSYNPQLAVSRWVESLTPEGICILHWSTGHDADFSNDGADCFMASRDDYAELLAPYFRSVTEIKLLPRGPGHEAEQCLVVGYGKGL